MDSETIYQFFKDMEMQMHNDVRFEDNHYLEREKKKRTSPFQAMNL